MSVTRDMIIEKVMNQENLPSLDRNVLEISNKILNSDQNRVNFKSIAKIIERDLGLAAKILKIANSAYYAGRYGRIGSISQAISRLGLKQIADICLALTSMKLFPRPSRLIDLENFWCHSISVGLVTRALTKMVSQATNIEENDAYIAGLFHDIGILVLDMVANELYERSRDNDSPELASGSTRELETMGIDHAEIGGLVTKRWNFPNSVVQAIVYHHNPEKAPVEKLKLIQLVHLADFSCSVLGKFEEGEQQPQNCSFTIWDDLDISITAMQDIIKQTEAHIERGGTIVDYGL